MKIAILFDTISTDIGAKQFDGMIDMFSAGNHEIKVLCRGIEGRAGDRYDILRNRKDVIWSNGMPVLIEAELKYGFKPDVVLNNSFQYQDCVFYNKAEVLL